MSDRLLVLVHPVHFSELFCICIQSLKTMYSISILKMPAYNPPDTPCVTTLHEAAPALSTPTPYASVPDPAAPAANPPPPILASAAHGHSHLILR